MTQQNSNNSQFSKEEDVIDFIALAKKIWKGRKIVIRTMLIFMAIGLFVAVFSEKEYTASTTFVPQTSNSKVGGSLGGLAAMAGINLGGISNGSDIGPILYQQIMNSTPFKKELLKTSLTISAQKDKVSFANYYTEIYSPSLFGYFKKYIIGLPGIIIGTIKSQSNEIVLSEFDTVNNVVRISQEEYPLFKILNSLISLDFNEDDGYVNIKVKMPEALASAELAQRAQTLLQEYIINFKIQKSKEQLNFIKERYVEVEGKFKSIQKKLAVNNDRNQFVTKAIAKTSTQILQDEYDLIYGVYLELSKQLETQYIQVTEDTPIFTVLEPVVVPLEKSKPKRFIILISWTFIGGLIGIVSVFARGSLLKIKERWNENV